MHEDELHPELRAALEPVGRDLRATCPVSPRFEAWDYPRELAGVMAWAPDGSGRGVAVLVGQDPMEQLAQVADGMQEWAVEALWNAGLPAVWPHCPAHPDTHPLAVRSEGGRVGWCCPRTGELVAAVGELGGEPGQAG
ncbi:hypothetical protein [Microtetraspora sp. NBRC 13810]|uniref:hypothetical protein n=1 Tax=Microtetraspora sp. NBRC 13810 TaxID=3030990 RepID=UPI002556FB5A|nr:hypothetical protein [Microtetraspora sp. NBRC 13810]